MIATLADLWYVVSLTTGIATLCMCEEDACSEAAAVTAGNARKCSV